MYSSNTIRRYHAVLVDFAHTMCGRSWSTITRTDIEKYIASKSSASESTKASVLSAVRGVFRFACTHYGLPVNPARYISAPKLQKRIPHVVAADDIAAAMKAAPKRIQLAIMLMHLCGLRVSECLSLTIEDFKEHRIIVRGKGKRNVTYMLLASSRSSPTSFAQVAYSFPTPATANSDTIYIALFVLSVLKCHRTCCDIHLLLIWLMQASL